MSVESVKKQLEQEFPNIPFAVEKVGEGIKVKLTQRLETADFARFARFIEKQFKGSWVPLGKNSHFRVPVDTSQIEVPKLEHLVKLASLLDEAREIMKRMGY